VADWQAAVSGHPDLLVDDQVPPQPAGLEAMVEAASGANRYPEMAAGAAVRAGLAAAADPAASHEASVNQEWLQRYANTVMNTFGTPGRVLVRGQGAPVWGAAGAE